jgi:putative transposase
LYAGLFLNGAQVEGDEQKMREDLGRKRYLKKRIFDIVIINQAFRYELKPNNKQVTLFIKYCGVARFVWNWGLARRKAEYESTGKSSNAIEQHRQLNALKKTEFPWMYDVSKCAPQSALQNLDRAFINFWRECKKGRKVGYPKFKKKGMHDSFRLMGQIHIFGNGIQLPRLGQIRTKESTIKFKGRILSATVSREADRWFVSLTVERERDIPVRFAQL